MTLPSIYRNLERQYGMMWDIGVPPNPSQINTPCISVPPCRNNLTRMQLDLPFYIELDVFIQRNKLTKSMQLADTSMLRQIYGVKTKDGIKEIYRWLQWKRKVKIARRNDWKGRRSYLKTCGSQNQEILQKEEMVMQEPGEKCPCSNSMKIRHP